MHLADFARSILSLSEESVYHIWKMMLEAREHFFVILDEYVSLRGMVSMEDVIEMITEVEIVDEDDVQVDM